MVQAVVQGIGMRLVAVLAWCIGGEYGAVSCVGKDTCQVAVGLCGA